MCAQASKTAKRGWRLLELAAVYTLFIVLFDAPLWRPGWALTAADNVHVAEAQAWCNGSLALPKRQWDTAVYDGRVYNHFPPLLTLISAAVLPFSPDGVPFNVLAVLFAWPIPALAYALFLRRTGSGWQAAILACVYLLGTSQYCVLSRSLGSGMVWQLNHAASQLGLLLFLLAYYGSVSAGLLGPGLLLASWTRLTMLVYWAPAMWRAWTGEPAGRGRRLAWMAVWGVVVVGFLGTMNSLKFGHPWATGYGAIYEGRDDDWARAAREGIFSIRFLPRNLYAMNLGFPKIVPEPGGFKLASNSQGTGIWWTTPLLLYVCVDWRRIMADRRNLVLLTAVMAVYIALMLFHTTGADQRGYNRFSLDFVLCLMAVSAPWVFEGRRKFVSAVLAVWSVSYFCFLNG